MHKLILGIKIDGKVVYLTTKEVKDDFRLSILVEIIKLFFKHNCWKEMNMDSNLEKTLRQRQNAGECIICGKKIDSKMPTIVLEHHKLELVEICESHIKQIWRIRVQ